MLDERMSRVSTYGLLAGLLFASGHLQASNFTENCWSLKPQCGDVTIDLGDSKEKVATHCGMPSEDPKFTKPNEDFGGRDDEFIETWYYRDGENWCRGNTQFIIFDSRGKIIYISGDMG